MSDDVTGLFMNLSEKHWKRVFQMIGFLKQSKSVYSDVNSISLMNELILNGFQKRSLIAVFVQAGL